MQTFIYWILLLIIFAISRWAIPRLAQRTGKRRVQVARWSDFGLIVLSSLIFPVTLGWHLSALFWLLGYLVLFGGAWLLMTAHVVKV